MMYPEKESGFDRILYKAPYLDGKFVVIVCYQNVMKDGNSYIGKITHSVEKNEYELQTEIRNLREIVGEMAECRRSDRAVCLLFKRLAQALRSSATSNKGSLQQSLVLPYAQD